MSNWRPVARVDHAEVQGTCFSCHNGTTAIGKPTNHIPSDNNCDSCHSTVTWSTAKFSHTGIVNGCSGCHNGTTRHRQDRDPHADDADLRVLPWDHGLAAGDARRPHTGAGHLRRLPQRHHRHRQVGDAYSDHRGCETCHSTMAWTPTTFTHAGITTGCSSCHNGTNATGKNATHILTTTRCESCHNVTTWKPATRVDHAEVQGTCFSCHNGSVATGKPATPHSLLEHL